MENKNNNFAILALVAIVAVIGVVSLVMMMSGSSNNNEFAIPTYVAADGNVGGQAYGLRTMSLYPSRNSVPAPAPVIVDNSLDDGTVNLGDGDMYDTLQCSGWDSDSECNTWTVLAVDVGSDLTLGDTVCRDPDTLDWYSC